MTETTLLEDLEDLHKQATEESSHNYTGKCIRLAINALKFKDMEISRLSDLIDRECRRAEDAHGMTMGQSLEIEHMREALECASYYIARLESVHRGVPVRDLDEASEAWKTAKRRLMPKGPAGDYGQVGWMGGEFDR